MVRETLTGYWALVSGLTEVTVERARAAARALVAQGDATRDQVSTITQEIAETSRANREALVRLVRYEAERTAGMLGFASTDDVATLRGRVAELERSVAELRAALDASTRDASEVAEASRATEAPTKATKATKAAKATEATKAPARKATARSAKAAAAPAGSKSTKAKAAPRKRTADGARGPGGRS